MRWTKGELTVSSIFSCSSVKVMPDERAMKRRARMLIIFIVYIITCEWIRFLLNYYNYYMQEQGGKQQIVERVSSFDWIIHPEQSPKTKGLALGNVAFAEDEQALRQHQIKAVISVFGQAQLKLPQDIKHLRILIADDPAQNIKCFFDSSAKFIKEQIKNHNVLVHCKAGVSRSATIVAAYLMVSRKINANQAISLLQQKRSIVFPNKGFVKQLKNYHKQLLQRRQNQGKCCIY